MNATIKGLRFQVAGEPGSSENRQNVKEFIARFIHKTWAVRLRKEYDNAKTLDGHAIRVIVADEKGERCAGYVSSEEMPSIWNLMGDFNEINALIGEVRSEQYIVVIDESDIFRKRGKRERILSPFPFPQILPDLTKVNPKEFIETPYRAIIACLKNRRPDIDYYTENNTKTNDVKTILLDWLRQVDMTRHFCSYNNDEVSEIITSILFLLFIPSHNSDLIFDF